MTFPDLVNASFEAAGTLFNWWNVRRLLRDKAVAGFSPLATGCYTAWGFWNMFYYPHLDQWLSFWGGFGTTLMNCWYLYLIWYFTRSKQ